MTSHPTGKENDFNTNQTLLTKVKTIKKIHDVQYFGRTQMHMNSTGVKNCSNTYTLKRTWLNNVS